MCKYCKTTHRDGLQAGADFGNGDHRFRILNGGKIAARMDCWDFALNSVKIKFCPFCGRRLEFKPEMPKKTRVK